MVCVPFLVKAGSDFTTVDAVTFRLYQEHKWDSLIVVGKKALKDDIDYYFLRMRLGVAFYSKTKYIPAAENFRKAIFFNSQDQAAWQYLYRSYVLANRSNDALALVKRMPVEIRQAYKDDKKFIEMISFEGGPTFSSDSKAQNNLDIKSQPGPYGEQDLYGNSYYGQLGMLMNLSGKINLSVAYSYMDFTKLKFYQYSQFDNQLISRADSFWGFINNYNFSPAIKTADFTYHVKQQDICVVSTILLPDGFRLEPAVHLLYVKYNLITPKYSKTNVMDTLVFDSIFPGNNYFASVEKENYSLIEKDTSFLNYVVSLGISKDFSVFNLRLNGSWSNLNNKTQKQIGAAFTFYPLGNLDFYGTSAVTGFFQGNDQRLILSQSLGGRVLRKLWLEGNVIYGDLTNANIANGSIVYNNADKIDYRIGGTLIWPLSKHIELSLMYQYFQKESSTLYYVFKNPIPDPTTTTETLYSKYHTNSIIIGIKWKL